MTVHLNNSQNAHLYETTIGRSGPSNSTNAARQALESSLASEGLVSVGEKGNSKVGDLHQSGARGAPVLEKPANSIADNAANVTDIALTIQELQNKVSTNQLNSTKTNLTNQNAKIEQQNSDIIKNIEETGNAMGAAQETGDFNKIFGWIATGATVIGAVAATVATGGAAAPLLAGAALALTLQLDQETGGHGMKALGDGIAKALETCGMDPADAAKYGPMAANGIILLLQIGIAVGTGGAGAGSVASTASGGLKMSQQAMAATKTIQAAAETTQTVASGVKAVGTTVKAVQEHEIAGMQVEKKYLDAAVAHTQDKVSAAMETLQAALGMIQSTTEIITGILHDSKESEGSIAQQTSI